MPPVRFPIEHLIDRPAADIAADLAMTTRSVQRWIAKGLNWEQADVFACKIMHLHPSSVFGDEWVEAADAAAEAALARLDLAAGE
jgi:hypothetical protein